MSEPAEIAKGLTKAQRRCLRCLNGTWQAGPELPASVIKCLPAFREAGLVERQFGDEDAPTYQVDDGCIAVRVSACWFFRLTPLGLAVRRHLLENGNGPTQQEEGE